MVELLVVIAVIAMLVAILLPAVNMARESARNTQCKNNIRQLAVAANMYETRMQSYPGYRSLLDGNPTSWVVRLAPDFGERAMYEKWRAAPGPEKLPWQFIPLLGCPSDPTVNESGPSLSYMANAGREGQEPQFNSPELGVFLDQIPPAKNRRAAIPMTTSAFLEDHGDGASKTLLLAENIQLLFDNGQTGTRWDRADNKMSNVVVWHCTTNPAPVLRVSGDLRNRRLSSATARPASNHSGGANVALCDQRVVFLRDDIDYLVYIRLMVPDDKHIGEVDAECGAALKMPAILDELGPLSSSAYE
jgi:type II secretory pathway pseudopilin PulG